MFEKLLADALAPFNAKLAAQMESVKNAKDAYDAEFQKLQDLLNGDLKEEIIDASAAETVGASAAPSAIITEGV